MYKFLLPTDGSQNSLRAAHSLLKIAKSHVEADYIVLSVYQGTFLGGEAALASIERNEILEYARSSAREAVEKTGAILKEAGVEVKELIKEGDPGPVIVDTAKSLDVNQIVLGARGISKVKELFMGSVSRKVVHLSECAVTLVK